jgi:predicted RND superfamily exporter protein
MANVAAGPTRPSAAVPAAPAAPAAKGAAAGAAALGRWAGWLARRRLSAAVLVLAAVVPLAAGLSRLRLGGDPLAFLPADHPDVVAFRSMAARFRLLDKIVVTLDVPPPGGDGPAAVAPSTPPDAAGLFTPDRLAALRAVTENAAALPGVGSVLSLANVLDLAPGDGAEGGLEVRPLLDLGSAAAAGAPDAAALAALRARVLSRAHIVGTLVSRAGDAALLLVTPAPGVDPASLLPAVRAAAGAAAPHLVAHVGGAPAIAAAASALGGDPPTVRAFAALAVALLLLSWLGLGRAGPLALLPGALAAAASLGLAGWVGAGAGGRLDPVVVLGALAMLGAGAAVAAPLCAARAGGLGLRAALAAVGAAPLCAPLAAAAPFAALAVAAPGPLRALGVVTASGALLAGALAIPLLAALLGPGAPQASGARPPAVPRARAPAPALARLADPLGRAAAALHPVLALALLLVALSGALLAARARPRADLSLAAAFPRGAEPLVVERFLDTKAGGANLLHVHVRGDLRDPHVLRVVRALQDRIELLPRVRVTRSVADVIELVAGLMIGRPGLPGTRGALGDMIGFLDGDPTVPAIATDDRREALVLVELDGPDHDGAAAAAVRDAMHAVLPAEPAVAPLAAVPLDAPGARAALAVELAYRVAAAVHRAGAPVPTDAAVRLVAAGLAAEAGRLPPPPRDRTADALCVLLEEASFPVDLAHGTTDAAPPDFASAALALVDAAAAPESAPADTTGALEAVLRARFPAAAADATESKYFGDAARAVAKGVRDARLRAFLDARALELSRALGAPAPAAAEPAVRGALAGVAFPTALVAMPAGEALPAGAEPVAVNATLSGPPLLEAASSAAVARADLAVQIALLAVLLVVALGGAVAAAPGATCAAWGAALCGLGAVLALQRAVEPTTPAAFALAASLAGAFAVAAAAGRNAAGSAAAWRAAVALALAFAAAVGLLVTAGAPPVARLGAVAAIAVALSVPLAALARVPAAMRTAARR